MNHILSPPGRKGDEDRKTTVTNKVSVRAPRLAPTRPLSLYASVLLVRARNTGQVELQVGTLDHRFALLLRSCTPWEMSNDLDEDGNGMPHAPL